MPDRFAFLRRPASLSARVTGLVGIAMMVVLLLFSWVSVGSLDRKRPPTSPSLSF